MGWEGLLDYHLRTQSAKNDPPIIPPLPEEKTPAPDKKIKEISKDRFRVDHFTYS